MCRPTDFLAVCGDRACTEYSELVSWGHRHDYEYPADCSCGHGFDYHDFSTNEQPCWWPGCSCRRYCVAEPHRKEKPIGQCNHYPGQIECDWCRRETTL